MTISPLRGYAYMFGNIICGAACYLGIEYVYRHFPTIDPMNAMFFGFAGAVIITAPIFLGVPRLRRAITTATREHGRTLFVISLLNVIAPLMWFFGLSYATAGTMNLINKSQFLFVFILGAVFLGERMRWRELVGVAIAIGGLVTIALFRAEVPLIAIPFGLASAFFYGLQSFLVKKYVTHIDGTSFAFGRAIIITLAIGGILAVLGRLQFPPLIAIALLTCAEISGLIIGRIFYFEAHNHLPVGKLNFIGLLEPVIVIGAAYLLLGESLTTQKLVGAALIIGGMAVFLRAQFTMKKTEAKS